jgi:hypothetical protein
MFESTIDILFESPETVIALLPALYLTGKVLWKARNALKHSIMCATVLGLLPVFVLFVIGGLAKSSTWTALGTDLFRFEASIAAGIVQFYDTMLAAWLHVFELVVDSLLSISLFQPDVWATAVHTVLQSWILVFVLHFATGVVLVYGLYRGIGMATMDTLLRVGGAMLLLAGLFVVLLQRRVVALGASEIGVLLIAVVGLEMGVGAVLLGVEPDFSGDPDEAFSDSSAMSSVRNLLSRAKRFRPGPNDE